MADVTRPASLQTLPIELSSNICLFLTSGHQIVALRQMCKALEAATSDVFAALYLEQLTCYMMDPARLQRLEHILACPHLAKRVQQLTLCLSPWENAEATSIQLAPRASGILGHEQHRYFRRMRSACHRLDRTRTLDVSRVSALMSSLGPEVMLKIDFASAYRTDQHQPIPAAVMRALSRSSRPLHGIKLAGDILPASDGNDALLVQQASRLLTLEYEVQKPGPQSMSNYATHDRSLGLLMGAAVKIAQLHVQFEPYTLN